MSCILNGCQVEFEDKQGEMFVCDAYRIIDTFVFRFNTDMFKHPIPITEQHKPDCFVNREGQYLVLDRTDDLAVLVADTIKVTELSERMKDASARYIQEVNLNVFGGGA